MSLNKLNLTLDNIIYNCVSRGKDDIEIILPQRTPSEKTYYSEFTKEKSVILSPVVQVEIKLFLTMSSSYVPQVYIHGENKKVKVKYANTLQVQSNAVNLLVFTTTDGGTTWLVNSSVYSKNPESPTEVVTSVNNKKGPTIVLDASDIHMDGEKGPTIKQQFDAVETRIVTLQETVTSDVTNEISTKLPDMIKVQIGDTEIVAESI